MTIDHPLLATIFVSCLVIRAVYEILKKARKIDPESKPVFAVILTVMLTLWISWFMACAAEPHTSELPLIARWSGLALFIIGVILAVGALIQLRGVENIDHLVTTGLFRKLRHPMYVGFICWLVGWSVYHSALVSLGLGVLGIASVLQWRHWEEASLRLQFGEAYEQYRLATWF